MPRPCAKISAAVLGRSSNSRVCAMSLRRQLAFAAVFFSSLARPQKMTLG